MSAEQRRRAFEAFYTTKPGGSGLGLAVVRSMLDLYGARVSVRSAPGQGTTFALEIPLAAEPAGALPGRPEKDPARRRSEMRAAGAPAPTGRGEEVDHA